jgi:hypothetical protein
MFKLVALAAMIHRGRIRTPREPNRVHRSSNPQARIRWYS